MGEMPDDTYDADSAEARPVASSGEEYSDPHGLPWPGPRAAGPGEDYAQPRGAIARGMGASTRGADQAPGPFTSSIYARNLPPPPGVARPGGPAPGGVRPNSLAVASIVFGFLFSPLGVVLGLLALRRMSQTGSGDRRLAFAGIAVSVLSFAAGVVLFATGYSADFGRLNAAGAAHWTGERAGRLLPADPGLVRGVLLGADAGAGGGMGGHPVG
jgi:hypothetical protein